MEVYPKGANIPLNAYSYWQVEQGVIKLSSLDTQGNETIVGLVGPGMVFAADWSILIPYRATALSEVTLHRFSSKAVDASAELTGVVLSALKRRLQQAEALAAIVGQLRIEARLQQLLLLLAQEFGQPVAEGLRLQIRLTHEELASLICSSRVSVTRLLGQFKRQGWLMVDWKRYLVLKKLGITEFEKRSGSFRLPPLRSSTDD